MLTAAPIGILFGWLFPDVTGGLVRLANTERQRASRYLGRPDTAPLPEALRSGADHSRHVSGQWSAFISS